jgi:dTDP-4-amino-4,6-dideoxygalactose transaminase
VKLRHLESWTERRRARAKQYDAAFAGVPEVVVPAAGPGSRHVYHQYTLRARERDALQCRLHDAGIQTMIYYPVPLHRQAVHARLGYASGAFPRAEAAAREVLSLPLYPELPPADQERVIAAVCESGARFGFRASA